MTGLPLRLASLIVLLPLRTAVPMMALLLILSISLRPISVNWFYGARGPGRHLLAKTLYTRTLAILLFLLLARRRTIVENLTRNWWGSLSPRLACTTQVMLFPLDREPMWTMVLQACLTLRGLTGRQGIL